MPAFSYPTNVRFSWLDGDILAFRSLTDAPVKPRLSARLLWLVSV